MTPRAASVLPAVILRARRFDAMAALVVVVAQVVWWPLSRGGLGEGRAGRGWWVVLPLACLAGVVVGLRRDHPERAVAGALVCAVAGLAVPAATGASAGLRAADLLCGPAAVVLTVYSLAVHRTAVVSVIGAAAVPIVGAGYYLGRGSGIRPAAGTAVLLAAGIAAVWSSGRLRRRVRALRRAVRDYQAGAHVLPAHAAAAERRRLAAELHDVAAHRMTAVVVGAAAALRLSDPVREAEALSHALREGHRAVEELDRLVTLGAATDRIGEVDIDRLLTDHGVGTYHRSGPPLSDTQARLVYRVVREALTNVARYADGAGVEVRVRNGNGRLVVTVVDGGGGAAGEGLGSGTGLAGLDAAVRAAGGVLAAGRHGDGWQVSAEIGSPGPGRSGPGAATMRGDRALVVLAAGLSLGVVLLPSAGDRDLLSGAAAAAVLLVPLLSHSATLAWRRTRPLPAFGIAWSILGAWVLAGYAGVTGLDAADVFLASWWIELMLVYSIGAYGRTARHGWWAPGMVSALGGAALAGGTGMHGNRLGVAAVLAVLSLPLTLLAWWAGRFVAGARRRRAARDDRARTAEQEAVADAASSSRAQLGQDLRRDARRHAMAVVAAATAGRLAEVLAEGRATLTALRVLVHTPADQVPEPPPSLLGLDHLATRRHAALTVTRPTAPLPAALEVLIYRAVAAMLDDGAVVEVRAQPSGVDISILGGRARDEHAVRRLRDIVDAADGRAHVAGDEETVRIWLPRTPA